MNPELRFAELLCTRLCHDLTGPIGALSNGAEFLSEEGFGLQGQAVELISSSAAQAVSRLQFYRKAYGRINDSGEASLSDLKKVTEDFFAGSKVVVDWPDTHTDAVGVPLSYKMGRLMLNLMTIASGSLLRGGTLSVRISASGQMKEVSLRAAGNAIKLDPDITATLLGGISAEQLTPKTVQAELTRRLANEIKAELGWTAGEADLSFTIRQPLGAAEATEQQHG